MSTLSPTSEKVAAVGFEEPANSSENTGVADESGANSGALSGDSAESGALPPQAGPDVAAIIQALANLPEEARQAIAAALRGKAT